MFVEPVELSGRFIKLEPLSEVHISGLSEVGKDKSIWQYMIYGEVTTVEKMGNWVREIIARKDAGTDQPFAVRHLQSGLLVGATRYMEIRPAHRGLEIGGTWYGVEFQKTPVNTESKYLLLKHAFEVLGCIRVQFKADSRNERSLAAIERIGAKKEGIFRNHMILENGVSRNSVYYSIIDSEWLLVKKKMEEKLVKYLDMTDLS